MTGSGIPVRSPRTSAIHTIQNVRNPIQSTHIVNRVLCFFIVLLSTNAFEPLSDLGHCHHNIPVKSPHGGTPMRPHRRVSPESKCCLSRSFPGSLRPLVSGHHWVC